MPESSVPTPAERMEVSQEAPDLGAKESENWQKMRAERKQAREQILSKLRESSRADKKSIQRDVSKKRNENSGFEREMQNNKPREPFYNGPDSHNLNPMRGVPGPWPMAPWVPVHP